MSRLHFIIIITVLISFISCDKSINGKIKNNFGEPVSNVVIKIPNSDFKTRSDKDGTFKLDYVPGKFKVNFEKDGYLPESKSLNISQKSKYPIGKIEMIKLPKSKGIFYIDSNINKYIELPRLSLAHTKETKYSMGKGYYKRYNYYFPQDTSGLVIKSDTSETLRFFDYKAKSTYLTRADKNLYMVKYAVSALNRDAKGLFVDTEQERIASGIRILKFKPKEKSSKYSFVEISDKYGKEYLSGYGYCFNLNGKDDN